MTVQLNLSYYYKIEGKTPLPGYEVIHNDIVEVKQMTTYYVSLRSTLCGREYGVTTEYFNKLKGKNNV